MGDSLTRAIMLGPCTFPGGANPDGTIGPSGKAWIFEDDDEKMRKWNENRNMTFRQRKARDEMEKMNNKTAGSK